MYDTLEERLGIRIAHGGEGGGGGGGISYDSTLGAFGSAIGSYFGGKIAGPPGSRVGGFVGKGIGYGPGLAEAGVQKGISDASRRANQAPRRARLQRQRLWWLRATLALTPERTEPAKDAGSFNCPSTSQSPTPGPILQRPHPR